MPLPYAKIIHPAHNSYSPSGHLVVSNTSPHLLSNWTIDLEQYKLTFVFDGCPELVLDVNPREYLLDGLDGRLSLADKNEDVVKVQIFKAL